MLKTGYNTDIDISEKIIKINTMVPYKIIFNSVHDNTLNVAELIYVCTDIDDNLFFVSRNYIVENSDDKEFLDSLTISETYDTASQKIAMRTMKTHITRYFTDLKLYIDSDNTIYCYVKDIENEVKVRMEIPNDKLAEISYIDECILNKSTSETSFKIASSIGFTKNKDTTELFILDDIKSVEAAAVIHKYDLLTGFDKIKYKLFKPKEVSSIVTLAFIGNKENRDITILAPFEVDDIREDLYKGNTVTKLTQEYNGAYTQFVSSLTVDKVVLYNEEDDSVKTYTLIRGNNTSSIYRIILISEELQDKMQEMIK